MEEKPLHRKRIAKKRKGFNEEIFKKNFYLLGKISKPDEILNIPILWVNKKSTRLP